MGEAAGCIYIIKAFIALVLGHTELSNFNHSQGYSNDRRLSGMITIGTGVCASIYCFVVIIRREAPRCSFHCDGQC